MKLQIGIDVIMQQLKKWKQILFHSIALEKSLELQETQIETHRLVDIIIGLKH